MQNYDDWRRSLWERAEAIGRLFFDENTPAYHNLTERVFQELTSLEFEVTHRILDERKAENGRQENQASGTEDRSGK